MLSNQLIYALAWASFGLLHSLLARTWAIDFLKSLVGGWHRVVYNLIAFAHLGVVLALGYWLLGSLPVFPLPGWLRAVLYMLVAVGVGIIVASVHRHGFGRFFGWQLSEEIMPLQITGMYRWVRHPIYFGSLLIFWGMAQDPWWLATACWGTIYTLVGTLFEERDLVVKFGPAYQDYQRSVPMLIPWRAKCEPRSPSCTT